MSRQESRKMDLLITKIKTSKQKYVTFGWNLLCQGQTDAGLEEGHYGHNLTLAVSVPCASSGKI